MNSTTLSPEAASLLDSPGIRALLLTRGNDGAVMHHPVEFGQSVLNIETELRAHLTDKPRTDEWLVGLRDFLSDWIRAREDAAKFGGIVVQVDDDMNMGVRHV